MVVIGILAAALVVVVVSRWWVDGLVSGTELIVLSAIYGGLVFGLFAANGEPVATAVTLALLLASAGYAIYQAKKEGIRQYYKEKLEAYERTIQADPRNTAARVSLAETYYLMGDIDRAVAAMELAVLHSTTSVKEHHRLRQWQEEQQLRNSKTIACPNCHGKSLWGVQQCRICQAPLVYTSRAPLFAGGNAKPVPIRYYCAGIGWLIMTIVSFAALSRAQAGMIVVCITLATVGWLLLASSKRS